MRRIFYNLLLFMLTLGMGIFFYCQVFHGHVGLAIGIIAFLFVYALAMAASQFGMQKLQGYEKYVIYHRIEERDRPRILGYAVLALLPVNICVLLASLIPITTYEIWFITVFPCILLIALPIKEIYGVQYPLTHYKASFWLLEVGLCLGISLFSQSAVMLML